MNLKNFACLKQQTGAIARMALCPNEKWHFVRITSLLRLFAANVCILPVLLLLLPLALRKQPQWQQQKTPAEERAPP